VPAESRRLSARAVADDGPQHLRGGVSGGQQVDRGGDALSGAPVATIGEYRPDRVGEGGEGLGPGAVEHASRGPPITVERYPGAKLGHAAAVAPLVVGEDRHSHHGNPRGEGAQHRSVPAVADDATACSRIASWETQRST
jgi:hypothetical protein